MQLDVTLGNATMRPMYVKLFNQILTSSIANDRRLRHFFIDLLLCADARGLVMMTPEAIARVTGADMEEVRWGLAELEKPDPCSRTPDMEGRRIERLQGIGYGWRIINYEQYRAFKDADQMREATRIRVARHRAKGASHEKDKPSRNATCNAGNSITEGDAEGEAEAHPHTNTADPVCVVIEHHRKAHPSMVHSIEPVKALIRDRLRDGFSVDDLKKAIDGQARGRFYKGDNEAKTPFLSMGYLFENDDRVRRAMAEVDKAGPSKEQLAADAKKRDEEILRISEAARLRVIPPPAAPPRSP